MVALICARAGSKGLPGKNILPLAGRPLIVWAIDQALSVEGVDSVVVSTDSDEIAKIAREAGADVPFLRPAELARDDSPEWLVWRHTLNYIKQSSGHLPDALMIVPATSPLRATEDLQRCVGRIQEWGRGCRNHCDRPASKSVLQYGQSRIGWYGSSNIRKPRAFHSPPGCSDRLRHNDRGLCCQPGVCDVKRFSIRRTGSSRACSSRTGTGH